ncbi:MAG: bifunctional hydroxymethylpyrimidine kinase/phosphomethylpyrimidine kinase [Heyndrickxia faecalis]|jgi:hydroxymethylpyrimidine/phosphomethylpyrimidine kinase|nr:MULTISPECIES: bifunctional hydroxymethylpyrimidine kinase/phosphomethylpyrimidine kinase [Heyndrickxia]AEH53439.1 phosphomethylpyrimidine kinase [Heyndrickxia coagulans 2-6]APB36136.1 bifunctional hydroxymethylpyrimidine kinase/phosphomethylpyrimidine kinase [Heyndrickxia coagulans]AWP36991.1 bifunctional hydroxymethylpyrimidine kinase/phosphomethylpyrimidine kinase [Heyndrickxia coagulans]KYC63485.1 Hydroxymethylpyrimidine phosphate kinase ThiD [Heyndrickxia coagulans]KYC88549.1 Hydroxymet
MRPQVLTIAGTDSGGGAGIQADLKTFEERGVYGMSVIVAVTAQNTKGVQGIFPMPVDSIVRQMESIADDFSIAALKTGMLFDAERIEAVVDGIKRFKWRPLVVDPVMIAKGGTHLVAPEAIATIKKKLVPVADVITPNTPEAEVLSEMTIRTDQDREHAARLILKRGAGAVLLKGGHDLVTSETVRDCLVTREQTIWLESKRIDTVHTHGTGCTLSSLITAELAKGHPLEDSVKTAKKLLTRAISESPGIGHGHGPIAHWVLRDEDGERLQS